MVGTASRRTQTPRQTQKVKCLVGREVGLGRFRGVSSAVSAAAAIRSRRKQAPNYLELVVAARIASVYEKHFVAYGLLVAGAVGGVLLQGGTVRVGDAAAQIATAESVLAVGSVVLVLASRRWRARAISVLSPTAAVVAILVLAVQPDWPTWIAESSLISGSMAAAYRFLRLAAGAASGTTEAWLALGGTALAGYFSARLMAFYLLHGPLWLAGRFAIALLFIPLITLFVYRYGADVADPRDPEILG